MSLLKLQRQGGSYSLHEGEKSRGSQCDKERRLSEIELGLPHCIVLHGQHREHEHAGRTVFLN